MICGTEKFFISHNSEWKYIDDFAGLIDSLGFKPIVVEKEPNLGMDPDKKAQYYMQSSDIIIFIITKDAVDSAGRPHPKSNVAIEIGLAKEKFPPEKVIFVLEEEAETPTMVTATHIRVKSANYYRAIAELIKNIKSTFPEQRQEEQPAIGLDEIKRFIIFLLSKDTHGSAPRPVLLKLVDKYYSAGEQKFNIVRYELRKEGIIREGEIGLGRRYAHDLFLELTSLGWHLASKIVSEFEELKSEKMTEMEEED